MEEIVNQLNKLKKTDPKIAKKLGKQAAKKMHNVENKVARFN
jgi:hypothetical protein